MKKLLSELYSKPYLKDRKKVIVSILLLMLLGTCLQFFSAFLLNQVLSYLPQELGTNYEQHIAWTAMNDTKMILYALILAPLLEEVLFRSGLLLAVKSFAPFFVANLIQAAAFGIYHGEPVQSVYAFILGLVLGYIRYKAGTVGASFLVHAVINGTGLVVAVTPYFFDLNSPILLIATVSLGVALWSGYKLVGIWDGDCSCNNEP